MIRLSSFLLPLAAAIAVIATGIGFAADTAPAPEKAPTPTPSPAAKQDSEQALGALDALFAALRDGDTSAAAQRLATPAQRMISALSAAQLQRDHAEDLAEVLETHGAGSLTNFEPTVPGFANLMRNWESRFDIEDMTALTADLLALGQTAGVEAIPVPEDIEFRASDFVQRGTSHGWMDLTVIQNGREIPVGTLPLLKEDGEWRLMSVGGVTTIISTIASYGQTGDPAMFDAWAYRQTRATLVALHEAIQSLDSVPGADSASMADVLEMLVEAEAIDVDEWMTADRIRMIDETPTLVDQWGNPLTWAAINEDADGTIVSASWDGTAGTDDDITLASHAETRTGNSTVVLMIEYTTRNEDGEDVQKSAEISLAMADDKATNAVANFLEMAEDGLYRDTEFHRIIGNFMIQGGDPYTRTGGGQPGTGGPGYAIPDEINGLEFSSAGILAYANSGPNTSGSQFFITLVATTHLNDNYDRRRGSMTHYTIFGEVSSGGDAVQEIGAVRTGGPQNSTPVNSVRLQSVSVDRSPDFSYPVIKIEE